MAAILPTKSDLEKGGLVDFTGKHKSVSSNSLKIANALDVKHSNVTRVIKKLTENDKISRLNCEAEQLQKEIAQAFVCMKKENAEWRAQALLTTDTTKQTNDHIHWLQNKLTEVIPSSRRCTMLFIHIQQAITKTATGSAKTKREMMTGSQLFQVREIEQQVSKIIERLRRAGIDAVQIRDDTMAMIKAKSGLNNEA